MEKTRINKKALWAAVLLIAAAVAGIWIFQKWAGKRESDEEWAKAYMEMAAPYALAYDQLPADLEGWRGWQEQRDGAGDLYKLTDDDNEAIGANVLGSLSEAYEKLMRMRIAAPLNTQCQPLFERMEPYFARAFHWEEGTTPQQCLERLRALSEEGTMEEIRGLTRQVSELYASSGAEGMWPTASASDLQARTASSGDLQAVPGERISSDSDLRVLE